MVSACWKDVTDRLRDKPYVDSLLLGVKYVPKHIAFIYCGKNLLCASANSGNKHAEENAVEKFRYIKDLSYNKPYKLFVIKIDGKHSMSRPCAECTAKINRFCKRARVFYTNYDGELVEDIEMNNSHKSVRRTGRFNECQECF
tara:strand:+ start:4985 stop:5413 length:429 start_codon:yes stop_codon:yes gene_type:complete